MEWPDVVGTKETEYLPEKLIEGTKLFVLPPHSDLPKNAVLFVNGDIAQEGGPVLLVRFPSHDQQGSLAYVPVMGVHEFLGRACLTLTGPTGTRLQLENHQQYPVLIVDSEALPPKGGIPGSGSLLAVLDAKPSGAALFAVKPNGDCSTAGRLEVGSDSAHGALILRDKNGSEVFAADAATGVMEVGAHPDAGGTLRVWGPTAGTSGGLFPGVAIMGSKASIEMGGDGRSASQTLRRGDGLPTVVLDASKGDITLAGGDCAEEFAVAQGNEYAPGMAMVMGVDGLARPCQSDNDPKVIGICSGAGGLRPGVILQGQTERAGSKVPIAVAGKVWCLVDATRGPIQVGDLLVTCSTKGHAMRAGEEIPLPGRVVGKSIGSLLCGCGLLPVLVGRW